MAAKKKPAKLKGTKKRVAAFETAPLKLPAPPAPPSARAAAALAELRRLLPELEEDWRWAEERIASGATAPRGVWADLLEEVIQATAAARQSPGGPVPHQRLCKWLKVRWPALPDLGVVAGAFVRHHHGSALPDLLALCTAAGAEPSEQALRAIVAWGRRCPHASTRAAANRLNETLCLFGPQPELPSGPAEAEVWARACWIEAREGAALTAARPALEAAREGGAPSVRFFASCALRHLARQGGLDAALPALVAPDPSSFPDVEHTSPWGFNATISTARAARHHGEREGNGDPTRNAERFVCAVCAAAELTPLFYFGWADPTGHGDLWELRCRECGCHTVYEVDD